MENASKALIMAGGVLIGIILLSIMVYAFRSSGVLPNEYEQRLQQQNVAKFNEPFLKYEGRSNVTIHELVTIINLAENHNEKEANLVLDVIIDGISYISKSNFDEKEKINQLQNNTNLYVCLGIEYDKDTKKINVIKFRHI